MSIRISVAANDDCDRVSISIFPSYSDTEDGFPPPTTSQPQPLTPRYEAIGDLPEVATVEEKEKYCFHFQLIRPRLKDLRLTN